MKSKLTILVLAATAAFLPLEAAKKPVAPKSADELLAGAKKVWSQDFESFAVGACPYAAKCGTNDCFGVSDRRACLGAKSLLVEPSSTSVQPNEWKWTVSDFGRGLPKSMRGHLVVRFCYYCDSPRGASTASDFLISFDGEQHSFVRIALGGESSLACAGKTKSGDVKPKDKEDKIYPVGFGFPTQASYHWYRYTAKVPVGRAVEGNVSASMEVLGADGKWKFLSGGCLADPEKYWPAANAGLVLSGLSSRRWGSSYRAFFDNIEVYVAKEQASASVGLDEEDIISLDE